MRFESTGFGLLLTGAAGGLDAYSYLAHGGVFAGLQTGNLILLGVQVGQGHWPTALRYVAALLAFALGTAVIRLLQRHRHLTHRATLRRRTILGYAVLLLAVVGVAGPRLGDRWAVVGLALAAAALLQEFRQLNGGPFTPLMMTGNLRTLTASAVDGVLFGEPAARRQAARTGALMLSFGVGAAVVAVLVAAHGPLALGVPAALLGLAALSRP
ncbi:YoaK family protein [Lacticaseibacillus absianus]|uniref:YoaK family protein n=1 Tax=Lacticaseibacillus absianus TaxID=2729623 RepID=UPI0015C78803|nr:YoaK family protein [Lacticaseibacillus absianus]